MASELAAGGFDPLHNCIPPTSHFIRILRVLSRLVFLIGELAIGHSSAQRTVEIVDVSLYSARRVHADPRSDSLLSPPQSVCSDLFTTVYLRHRHGTWY